MRAVATLLASVALVACHDAGTRADTLATPLPGALSGIVRMGERCSLPCYFQVTVSIHNPTDGDAYVQRCALANDANVSFDLLGTPASGLYVPSHGKALDRFSVNVAVPLKRITDGPSGAALRCVGLDWHGNVPM